MVQAALDKDAIIAIVMDYFEGWFDGDALRMERALHSWITIGRQCASTLSAILQVIDELQRLVSGVAEWSG